jgi:hypothetical protein
MAMSTLQPSLAPSTSPRKTAAVAGALYLVTFVSSIPAVALIGPVLSDPEYVIGPGSDTQVLWGSLLDLVNALACVGTAVVLFPLIRRVHEAAALGFVTARVLEAAIILVGVMALFTVVTLRTPNTTGTDADMLVAVAGALVALRDWTFVFGPGLIPALNALLFGYILFRSRLVPRIIPTLGLVGAPLLLSSTVGTMLGANSPGTVWTAIATVPIFLWELSVGLWMLVKGFDSRALSHVVNSGARD